ncbi:MAG: hypothetical protein M5U09_19150 [Gammaproteobacteria bacterium]|nr:hypothetical protein [Gammaproteobacteria bacterium]
MSVSGTTPRTTLTPASDDAALRLAELHDATGVPATFKLVGEKARVLAARRPEVLAALSRHAIGYHTDYHSVHPVVTEYCEPLPFEEGQALFELFETQGCRDVAALTGQAPCTFGQAGGAWSPVIYPVLRKWGIPTYVDEGPWIGLDERPFWFMGVLNVMRMRSACVRFDHRRPEGLAAGLTAYDQALDALEARGGGLLSIYFHPCEWSTDAFWDGVNFAKGANPPRAQWQPAPLAPPAEVGQRFARMEQYLAHVAASRAEGVTCADLVELYPDRTRGRAVSRDELLAAVADWQDAVDFAKVDHGWLTAGEVLTTTSALLLGESAVPLPCDGPRTDLPKLKEPFEGVGRRPAVRRAVRAALHRPGRRWLRAAAAPGRRAAGGADGSHRGVPVRGATLVTARR